MYALQDAGLAVSPLSPPQLPGGATDQLERRAVEATERGSLAAEDRHTVMYSSTAAVLQLLQSSAEGFAKMMEVVGEGETDTVLGGSGTKTGAYLGQRVDTFA